MIPFNKPHLTGREFPYIEEAVRASQLAGNGRFTQRCQSRLQALVGAPRVLLTHSCTAALEMAALLLDVGPGDEIIMPSFTFVSTANAFVLRGATPVFVDIRPDTLNIDEALIEAAITSRTKAIVVVHYAGVPCDMTRVMAIAERHGIEVVEDAAQALLSSYRGRPAGSFGALAAFSFHETKNIQCGEGGALVVNAERFGDRAEILWEKGTDRSKFARGEIQKYTWIDVGSSFLPGEISAAFLWAQLEASAEITAQRLALWDTYFEACAGLEHVGVTRPTVPADCVHNAHLFRCLLPPQVSRAAVLADLNRKGINAVFHYVPLHSAPAGLAHGRTVGAMTVTDDCANRLIRLPLWIGLGRDAVRQIVDEVADTLSVPGRS
ncbi:MAG TPA: dTDP-4-amino-4,6-dideoxygalactose transaminase [Vicinamibacterales bacterium]